MELVLDEERYGMNITRMELFQVSERRRFLKVETDEEISRWGEPLVDGRADIDEERVQAAHGHDWRNPVWRHADGTVAEW